MDHQQTEPIEMPPALASLRWDNRFIEQLPVDEDREIRPRQVVGALSSLVAPVEASAPQLIAHSPEVAEMLGLGEELWQDHRALLAQVLSGSQILSGSEPHAMNYGGHQFGHWAGQLGDGRAIALGEVVTAKAGHQTLQLKGAGPTPYSRGADGFAVLRSSVREFLCSEAMHHLGVATTRALSLVTTGDKVVRDMFYDGHPSPEAGAVVCRVAPSFIRFGNFQLLAARQDTTLLRELAEFTIEHYFETIATEHGDADPARYPALFAEVAERTLDLVLDWARVGFVHGVMNTDNMSIHGLTIDYGPYGWLEDFDPGWTPNTTDAAHRRYRYGQQLQVAHWNLLQLANALVPLTGDPDPFQETLDRFGSELVRRERETWAAKCGLAPDLDDDLVDEMLRDLFSLLASTETDMTIFFRGLADVVRANGEGSTTTPDGDSTRSMLLGEAYYNHDEARSVEAETEAWLDRFLQVQPTEAKPAHERGAEMDRVNPRFVLRNYLAQQAIDAAEEGDYSEIEELLDVLRRPYDEQPHRQRFAARRPEWARSRPGCSQLSCSS